MNPRDKIGNKSLQILCYNDSTNQYASSSPAIHGASYFCNKFKECAIHCWVQKDTSFDSADNAKLKPRENTSSVAICNFVLQTERGKFWSWWVIWRWDNRKREQACALVYIDDRSARLYDRLGKSPAAVITPPVYFSPVQTTACFCFCFLNHCCWRVVFFFFFLSRPLILRKNATKNSIAMKGKWLFPSGMPELQSFRRTISLLVHQHLALSFL